MTEKQFLIVGALLVVLFVGLFGFLTYKEYQTYEQLKTEVAALQRQIDNYTAEINKIKPLKAELEVLNKRFEKARKILPSDKELEGLITILNHLTQQTGLDHPRSLTKVKANRRGRSGKAAGDIEEILYNVELEGTFFNFVKFVNWLEHYKRHMRLRTFSITGGGEESKALDPTITPGEEPEANKLKLKFSVQLATYRYTGKSGESESEAELRVEDPKIDEGERIDLEAFGKRDPFRFAMTPKPEDGPDGDDDKTVREQDELLKQLEARLVEAQKLRSDVRKAKQVATIEVYRDILKRFGELETWFKAQKPARQDTRDAAKKLQDVIIDIAKRMDGILKDLIGKRLKEVLITIDEAIEGRRFGDAVTPMLEFFREFEKYNLPPATFDSVKEMFDKVYLALTALVEEENAYRECIALIESIEKGMGGYTKRHGQEGRLFADFLKRLIEVKIKAQNIKTFRELGMIVSGLIWVPDETNRIAIVESGKVKQAGTRPRRIFLEGEVIGTVKDETDTVRILKVTQFKSVEFEFRGLRIAQPLGDPKKDK